MRAARAITYGLVPVAVVALFVLIGATGISSRAAGWTYDLFLRLAPPVRPADEILLIDVDEEAASVAGPWPWTRDVLADGLMLLKEMDARYAVLDLPLMQRSQPSLDPVALRQALPDALNREFSQMEENIQSLFDAIRRGSVRPQDSARYVTDLVGLVAMAKVRLFNTGMGIERDDDALLGEAAAFFGRTYAPIDLLPAPDATVGKDLEDRVLQSFPLALILPGGDPSPVARGIRPAVLPLLRGARGAGFTGVLADVDGVLRRAFLTAAYQGKHLGQVTFTALLDLLGNPEVEVRPDRIVLHDAALPGKTPARISIPLTEAGQVLISWPRSANGDGFRHLSWAELLRHARLEDSLLSALRGMDDSGYLSYLRSDTPLLDLYEQASRQGRDMLARGDASAAGPWREARAEFFRLCDQFLNGDAQTRIMADANRALQSGTLTEEEKRGIESNRDSVPGTFENARRILSDLQATRAALQRSVSGSFCILSMAPALEPTAAGRTPFGAAATSATASAALANTILTGRFAREIPSRFALILAAALSLLVAAGVYRLRPLATLAVGVGCACVCAVALGAVFGLSAAFMDPLAPCGSAALTGAALSALKISRTRRQARALRGAFTGRLSAGGLKRLLAAPHQLIAEGEKRTITVLNAAVQGLPAGAASKDPAEVVKLLGSYHAGVGEMILGLEGSLGQAAADAVIAYFGAPLDCADHARKACLAALRMKAVEKELNILALPPFATRIGIETGACVVGTIGPGGMPGYSVVGAAPDFAARLLALNERYGSSILISEAVRGAAGAAFLARALDRVGTGRTGPAVRVFELVGERDGADAATVEALGIFEEARSRFEQREWRKALALFSRVLELIPGDGPADAYADRCRAMAANPDAPTLPFPG